MIRITEKVPFSDHQIWGGAVLNLSTDIQGSYNNTIADAVSRNNFSLAHHLISNLTILLFTPPQDVLGASHNEL